jgi:hypothetical protein
MICLGCHEEIELIEENYEIDRDGTIWLTCPWCGIKIEILPNENVPTAVLAQANGER